MIPQGARLLPDMEQELRPMASYTYALDLERNRFIGMTDGTAALKQAVFKILSTEKEYYSIYSDEYGIHARSLIGQDPILVRAELEYRIKEALLMDDRILDVQHYDLSYDEDHSTLSFTVVSTLGDIDIQEVM